MSLPRHPEIWGGGFNPARDLVIQLANTLVDFEPVLVLCNPGQPAVLKRHFDHRITLVELAVDEPWLRDSSPLFAERIGGARQGRLVAVEFALRRASRSPQVARLAGYMDLPLRRFPLSILDDDFSVDDAGAMLLSGGGLFASSRIQPQRERMEKLLETRFGITRPIWLPQTLAQDRRQKLTNLVRFIEPSGILLASHANRSDESMSITLDAYDQLTNGMLTDGLGKPYSVYQVHNPPPLRLSGRLLCCSYLNYYIANGVVCIPAFYKPRYDQRALELFKNLFPDYEIRQFQTLPLLAASGGLHCVTCQWPAGRTRQRRLLDGLEQLEHAAPAGE